MATSASDDGPILTQGVGYGVVCGLGLAFSAFMLLVIRLQTRFTDLKINTSDEFTSASKSVKPGLIACGIVSAWGISGPYWYAAGATVQVLLFAQNAAKIKLHAPNANTFLQIIYARWGSVSHIILMAFALATNIVSAMLITGASATITDLTGMSTIASCFLIPASVVIYVVIGGMRASLIGDYVHTTVLYIIILVFLFSVYSTSDKIGSPGRMYDLLVNAAATSPVEGNAQGSYITMRSKNGLIFGVINLVGNFATVYNDQAYWQRAIASRPETAVTGFLLGGLCWFPIPFGFATALGLAGIALSANLTPDQVSAGLVAPTAASLLLGQAGAICVIIILFLAVTSAASAELVAVSSIVSFDIFKTYINPAATEKQMMIVTHLSVVGYGLLMAILGVIFHQIGISMGWLYLFMGTILGGSVTPIAMCIMSRSANRTGCISGAVFGLVAGLIAWLITTSKLNDGVINVTTSGQDYPMLAGNLASIVLSTLISFTSSWLYPERYEFDKVEQILINQKTDVDKKSSEIESDSQDKVIEKLDYDNLQLDNNRKLLIKSFRVSVLWSIGLFLVLIILIPLPLFFSSHIYSKSGFTFWVTIGFIWLFFGLIGVVLVPIWESKNSLKNLLIRIFS